MNNSKQKQPPERRINRLMIDLHDDMLDATCLEHLPAKVRKQLQLKIYGRMMKLSRYAQQLLSKGGAA